MIGWLGRWARHPRYRGFYPWVGICLARGLVFGWIIELYVDALFFWRSGTDSGSVGHWAMTLGFVYYSAAALWVCLKTIRRFDELVVNAAESGQGLDHLRWLRGYLFKRDGLMFAGAVGALALFWYFQRGIIELFAWVVLGSLWALRGGFPLAVEGTTDALYKKPEVPGATLALTEWMEYGRRSEAELIISSAVAKPASTDCTISESGRHPVETTEVSPDWRDDL